MAYARDNWVEKTEQHMQIYYIQNNWMLNKLLAYGAGRSIFNHGDQFLGQLCFSYSLMIFQTIHSIGIYADDTIACSSVNGSAQFERVKMTAELQYDLRVIVEIRGW